MTKKHINYGQKGHLFWKKTKFKKSRLFPFKKISSPYTFDFPCNITDEAEGPPINCTWVDYSNSLIVTGQRQKCLGQTYFYNAVNRTAARFGSSNRLHPWQNRLLCTQGFGLENWAFVWKKMSSPPAHRAAQRDLRWRQSRRRTEWCPLARGTSGRE